MEELYPNLVPPQNIEAEEAVLGSILLASDSIISVMEFLTPEDFYRVSHQLIFAAKLPLIKAQRTHSARVHSDDGKVLHYNPYSHFASSDARCLFSKC